MKQKIEAIDLFCGIGGLTYGLRKVNIDVLAGLDNDQSCEYSYTKNNNCNFILADITKYNFKKMKKLYSNNSIRVLVGCAPCQPFSSHSFKVRNKKFDSQWNLIDYFLKAIKILNPHIISMENVRGVTKTNVFKKFIRNVKSLEYQLNYEIINCADYGIPQNRKRLVLLGSKFGEIEIPKKTHSKKNHIIVGKIIKNLPKLKAGEVSEKDSIHKTQNLSPLNIKRIKQSKPNGSWKDWDKKLLPDCYKKKSGSTYTTVYGRASWDSVSSTITTKFYIYGTGRFGHPEQNRAFSLREGALLQTFPKKYSFCKNSSIVTLGRHIGNAVPPKLGLEIGNAIKKHLKVNHVI